MNPSRTPWCCFVLCLLLAGCGPDPDMTMSEKQRRYAQDVPVSDAPRVKVTRIGVFRDDLAYGNKRGVYVITDTATGKEYIGISGVGISETGDHQVGKGRNADER